jgi:WD40 repeat protein
MSPCYGRLILATLLLCGSSALQADDAERLDRHGDPLPDGAVARLGTLRLRQGRFHALSYSPDGTMLASANASEPMRLWDAKTGRLLRTFGTGSPRQLCLAFSPDGRSLVSGGNETALHFWDVASGKEVKSLECHDSGISAVAFSDDGRTLASASYDKTVRLWDVASGKQLFKLEGHTAAASCVVFAGDTVVSGGEDAIVRLWNAKSGKVVTELRGHTAEIRALAVSPDKSQLVSASWDGSVRIWDLGEPKLLHKCTEHKAAATALVWLKDGKTVVSGGWDGTLCWWEVATGKLLRTTTARGNGHVYVLAEAADGKTLVSAGALGAPQFWDPATGEELDLFPGHHGYIGQVAFSADGKTVVTHGRDRTLNCWEASSGRLLRHRAEPSSENPAYPPRLAVLGPAGRLWAQVSHDYDVHVGLWDGKEDRKLNNEEADLDSRPARRPITCVAFAPDERRLAAGRADGGVSVWQVARSKPLPECGRQGTFVKGLAFSDDGRMLASLNASESVCRLWEVASGKLRAEIKDVVGQTLVLSGDGRSLAVWVPRARDRAAITVVDTATATVRFEVLSRRPEEQLTEAQFSPNGRFLAAGTSDGAVLLWDTATGKLLHVFRGPPEGVLTLAFSPDSRRLVSGNMDTTALVWAVPEPPPLERDPAPVLTDKDLETLWADLLADNAAVAWKATRRLAAAPKQTLPFLAEKLQPMPIDPKRIDRLIADLDSKQFDVRQRATTELERLGPAAEAALQKTLADKPALEVQQRVERLLAKLASLSLAPDALRVWRGMEVLERVGTAETRPILEKIAQEAALAALADEARATLARLK